LYGPVSLRFRLSDDLLEVDLDATWRREPARIVVHTPPVPGLRGLVFNGRRYTW
jgi:hypothetical protein